jgi:hypothetical protein
MRQLIAFAAIAAAAGTATADTLSLKNGQTVTGTYLGGNPREVRFDLGDHVQSFPTDQISNLQFDANGPSGYSTSAGPPPAPQPPAPQPVYNSNVPPPASAYNNGGYNNAPPLAAAPVPAAAPAPLGITIPAGTAVVVRTIDPINSDSTGLGATYRASIDEPVIVNGQTVIPRGADATLKVIGDQQSGKIEGRTSVALDLYTVTLNGQVVPLTTSAVTESSSSRGARSAGVIGGGAVLGTLLGAIAGGGRGAAIGAASGAAVGTGAEVLTHGQRVKIPAETRLTFTLNTEVSM